METDANDRAVRKWVQTRGDDFEWLANGRVRCRRNGREFVPRLEVLEAFVNGKKFKRLKDLEAHFDEMQQFEPFFVRSKNFEESIYCALTGQLLGVGVHAVKKHMEGKRFQKAKEAFMQGSLKLKPEPDIPDIIETLEKRSASSVAAGENETERESDAMDVDGASPPSVERSSKKRVR